MPSIQLNTVLLAQIATASIVAVIVKPGLCAVAVTRNGHPGLVVQARLGPTCRASHLALEEYFQLPRRRLSRRLCRLASRHSICTYLQVRINLFLQFALAPLKTEAREPFHDSLSSGLTYITDPIARQSAPHRPRSEANCFFPWP